MADFDINEIFSFDTNLIENVIWQYEQAESLKSLISQKDKWYNTNLVGFWNTIIDEFLNIKTAKDWGLNLWGQILKVPRNYSYNDNNMVLSTELYRRLILGELIKIRTNGSIPDINKYLNFVFRPDIGANSTVRAIDNFDMSITYIFNFSPTDEELALIYDRTLLPTPTGVEDKFYIFDANNIFGFYNTGFQPWGQAPFWGGKTV